MLSKQSEHKRRHKKRRDAGTIRLTTRDLSALLWIGQQYGTRLDSLREVLGRLAGWEGGISENAARRVVVRWEREGWVCAKRLQVKGPFWVWLTRKGLGKMGLTYAYRDLTNLSNAELEHLHAINAIRLEIEAEACASKKDASKFHWRSEREVLRGQVRNTGDVCLHRPDGEAVLQNGNRLAIEVELSAKKPSELAEILLEHLRGEEYLRAREDVGVSTARALSSGDRSLYDEIRYYAPKKILKLLRRVRAKLLTDGVISAEEAKRIRVLWYPLCTDEKLAQEEDEAVGLDGKEHGETNASASLAPLREKV